MFLALLAVVLAPADPSAQPAPAKPRLVCREAEGHLGSHVRTARQCKTAEQWAQEDADRERVPLNLRMTAGQGDTPTRPSTRPQ
jgi:hypothetical protein